MTITRAPNPMLRIPPVQNRSANMPVSKVVLSYVNPVQHQFAVDLRKEDGWFETGIPVTADIGIVGFCSNPCGGWIQAMIGSSEFHAAGRFPSDQMMDLKTILPGQYPTRSQNGSIRCASIRVIVAPPYRELARKSS